MSSNLVSLAHKVLSSYSIQPKEIRIIQSGGIKTVWKVTSTKGDYCLKRLRRSLEKSHFSIQAQHYLATKNANVPKIIKTKTGDLFVENKGQVFVLYEWVPGKDLKFNKSSHLRKAVERIAKFHVASKGFIPPSSCLESTKWGRWPHHYESMLERFKLWKKAKKQPKVAKVFNENVDEMIRNGEKALKLLKNSYYPTWLTFEKEKGLCHQDYGEGNALLLNDEVVVLDIDGATYDLPHRDLRKIIIKQMMDKGKGKWDPSICKNILSWYTAIHPLTAAQLKVLYIDCFFPHEFHATSKNPYHKNKSISASELAEAVKMEKSKAKHLKKLLL